MRAGILLLALILAAAAGGLWLAAPETGDDAGQAATTTTTTTTAQTDWALCDHYRERVKFNDPDPPGAQYYDGYLYWLVDEAACDVFDVNVAYDYVPDRPVSAGLLFYRVFIDGELVYEGYTTTWDFPDDKYNGIEAVVDVYAYRPAG